MQAVGGTKGTNDYTWLGIWTYVNNTFMLAENNTIARAVAPAAELEAGVLGKNP